MEQAVFLKQIKLSLSIILVFTTTIILTNCTANIKKQYNEIEKKFTCKLEKKIISINDANIVVERLEGDKVSFLISLVSFSFLTDMASHPKLLFKIYSNKENVSHKFDFKAISKNWDKSPTVKSHSPYNLDYAGITIDRVIFEKIINAEKLEILVQTNSDPAKLILNKLDLKPFREFMQECF